MSSTGLPITGYSPPNSVGSGCGTGMQSFFERSRAQDGVAHPKGFLQVLHDGGCRLPDEGCE